MIAISDVSRYDACMGRTDTIFMRKLPWVSLVGALFVIYPNILWIPWNWVRLGEGDKVGFCLFFLFRFLYFWGLMYVQLRSTLRRRSDSLRRRFLHNGMYTIGGCLFFVGLSWLLPLLDIWAAYTGNILVFQFVVSGLICVFTGHLAAFHDIQREKEREIAELKLANMQSQCQALSHQIHPHFFFNSLNGIASLISKGKKNCALDYLSHLSGVFRYILQSQDKGLVPLQEELNFLSSYRHVMEVRYAHKLRMEISVPEEASRRLLPVLSFLPLLENITVHNCIDSDHIMSVRIYLTSENELAMENPLYPKLTPPETHGTGLPHLSKRFLLLTGKPIKVEKQGVFRVLLPLYAHECANCRR